MEWEWSGSLDAGKAHSHNSPALLWLTGNASNDSQSRQSDVSRYLLRIALQRASQSYCDSELLETIATKGYFELAKCLFIRL